MDFEIKDIDIYNKPEDLAVMNPYNQVPVLVERDLVLHESNIINEYIDERFPHPQLMPGDPVMRGRGGWCCTVWKRIVQPRPSFGKPRRRQQGTGKSARSHRQRPDDAFPFVQQKQIHPRRRFSMIDVALAPLLWRLDHYDVKLGKSAAPLLKYAERIFQREAFIEALTPAEKAMRK
ncbi:RegF [Neisseria gonorrhoeae]|uniref:RegF n=1 Tax=Neisseria gonorrhoeae TaxID=485 RepID=A0A378W0T2_NEIGO|nr:RegF [Neisseria gonorrhoeae]